MIQAKRPHTAARPGDPVPPCSDCGTRFGRIKTGKTRPVRSSGARFGYDGQLCAGCYEKHDKRRKRVEQRLAEPRPSVAARPAPRQRLELSRNPRPRDICDLCGVPTEKHFDAAVFGIEGEHGSAGRVCGQCREELAEERAVTRHRTLAALRYQNPLWTDKTLYVGRESYRLTVLNPDFSESDLTPRAALRLLVLEARKRERKVAG